MRPNFLAWVTKLFQDERGAPSIKPVIALLGSLFLCGTMLANGLSKTAINPNDSLINAVLVITCIGMGSDSIDKFSFKPNSYRSPDQKDTTT